MTSLHTLFLLGLAVFTARAADDAAITSLAFSDPSKPTTLRVYVGNGDIRIFGTDELTGRVKVRSNVMTTSHSKVRSDGLRVVSAASACSLSEKDNVISLEYGHDSYPTGSGTKFDIDVPKSTHIVVSGNWGGDVSIESISGDVDVKNMNQTVTLAGLSGGAMVESLNGEVTASFIELSPEKPISLTAINGKITLKVPADAKANVRFRTQNGTILTDFDETTLITRAQPILEATSSKTSKEYSQVAAAHADEAGDAGHARTVEIRHEVLVRHVATRTMSRDGSIAPVAPIEPLDPLALTPSRAPRLPRMPYIPAIAGGKVVSGTLNGGGPEIQISTMNGDIIVRKLK